eukprot:CAMPEP_0201990112 /NCGR_PEP_ID=MMETSP0904-20121228/93205_1 /ASSEMBLY_ACC=CAM_ASM_000553 /TAXON_ID=420261 /ORGANISM="Thalassiosira antarctica, Strain CCMP982" /LENGTH=604 /DNA_ID=CAMNT_0048544363 /DNA_START=241 /DNA_END=2051 /DNA_ORIENTATION=-
MSFAEQLAARAAETTHSLHSQKKNRPPQPPQRSSNNKQRITPPPPRPGKILNKASSGASSPSLFAEQLKQRSSRSLNKSEKGARSSLQQNELTALSSRTAVTSPLVTTTPSDSSWGRALSSESNDTNNDVRERQRRLSSQRTILIPTCNSPNDYYEEEEDDEYASVGFSLMDASTASTVDEKNGDEAEDEGRESKVGATPARQKIRPTCHNTIMDSPPLLPFQGNHLSPIIAKGGGGGMHPSSPMNPELQSKLQRQLLKCQTSSNPSSSQPQQNHENHINPTNNNPIHNSSGIGNNAIFGAWAQVESLKQRCAEAEERARRECQRAEMASYELSLVKEEQSESQDQSLSQVQSISQDCHEDAATSTSLVAEDVTDDTVSGEGMAAPRDAAEMTNAPVTIEQESSRDSIPQEQSQVPQDVDAARLWKKRALEAEERLAKEVERLQRTAAASTSTSAPPSSTVPRHLEESPNLIRLKNAEIDVLRSQIHRLERRINEECERNDDLLLLQGSSSYYDHLGRGDAPPLVVASECMTSRSAPRTSTTNTELEEFRVLRNEVRHLQYQLRIKNNGTAGTANSTTGESTLSSLEYDNDGEGGGRLGYPDVG